MRPEEFPLFVKWVNHPEVLPYWYGRKITEEELHAEYRKYYFDGTEPERGRWFVIEADDHPIGMIAHNEINDHASSTSVDILIGESDYLGRGFGTDALRAFMGYCFGSLGLNRVELDVFPNNIRAILAYEKVGFVEEGLLREAERLDDKYVDVIRMGILKREFQIAA